MTHPKDIEYIRTMLPNISADVIEKQKILQPGNCVGFGGAFKLPMVIKMEMPNPAPNSNSCNVNECWGIRGNTSSTEAAAPQNKPEIMPPLQNNTNEVPIQNDMNNNVSTEMVTTEYVTETVDNNVVNNEFVADPVAEVMEVDTLDELEVTDNVNIVSNAEIVNNKKNNKKDQTVNVIKPTFIPPVN